jgi:acyl-homoserine lactone acylase PvdQ
MTLPLITTAMANTYFATTPREAQWAAITGAEQAISLTEAQTWLGQLCWNTTADCCGNTFDASYTRAVSELALALHSNPTALIGGAAATAALGPVKRQKLDALEVEYFDPRGSGATATATAPTAKGPLVLQRFPWLKDIIGCFLTNTGSSNLIRRVRS